MKIQLNSLDLLRCLNAVSKVMTSKNSLSILDTALLSETGGKYFITGGDTANSLTMPLTMTVLEGQFKPLCLQHKMFSSALANIGNQTLTIEIEELKKGFNLDVHYLTGSFKCVAQSAEEYPLTPSIPLDTDEQKQAAVQYQMPTAVMLSAIRNALANTANEELRLVMNGVYFDATQDGNVNMVASDGHVMYKETYDHGLPFYLTPLQGKGIIVPKTVIPAITEAFKACDLVTITANDNMLQIQGSSVLGGSASEQGTITLYARTIEGRYPNYGSVIPKDQPYHVTFDRKELIAAVKRVALFASDSTQLVALRYQGLEVTLRGEDIDFSTSANENLTPTDCNLPEGFQIGFKSTSLLTHLSYLTSDTVTLQVSDGTRAMLILPDDPTKGSGYVERIPKQTVKAADGTETTTPAVNTTVTCLVMPMLLNE